MVIFIKKILTKLIISFSELKTSKQAFTKGFWEPSELLNQEIAVICRPGAGLGPELACRANKRPLELAVFNLDILVPVIICLNKYINKNSYILIINTSQMSSYHEQDLKLSDQNSFFEHQRLLRKVWGELKLLKINLLILEQKELLSNKNSALFERLFISNIKF